MVSTLSSTFVDANVLMEIFFTRLRRQAAEAVIAMAAENELSLATSILAVSILFYYVEKDHFNKATAHEFVKSYRLLDINEADYDWAVANDQGDFEDALQVASALRHGCSKFLTLDGSLAAAHRKHIATTLIS